MTRPFFTVLTVETDISKLIGLVDEMHRMGGTAFTSDEVQLNTLIRRHLVEAATVARALVNSVLQRVQSRDLHDVVTAVEASAVKPSPANIDGEIALLNSQNSCPLEKR